MFKKHKFLHKAYLHSDPKLELVHQGILKLKYPAASAAQPGQALQQQPRDCSNLSRAGVIMRAGCRQHGPNAARDDCCTFFYIPLHDQSYYCKPVKNNDADRFYTKNYVRKRLVNIDFTLRAHRNGAHHKTSSMREQKKENDNFPQKKIFPTLQLENIGYWPIYGRGSPSAAHRPYPVSLFFFTILTISPVLLVVSRRIKKGNFCLFVYNKMKKSYFEDQHTPFGKRSSEEKLDFFQRSAVVVAAAAVAAAAATKNNNHEHGKIIFCYNCDRASRVSECTHITMPTSNVKSDTSSYNQQKLDRLKSLRENVNWEIEDERRELFRKIYPLVRDWHDQLPNLRDIFQPEEIDQLLWHSINYKCNSLDSDPGELFVKFVARSGYRDEPGVDEAGEPLLRRTTPIHRVARRRPPYWCLRVADLFHIYQRFDANYSDESGFTHFHAACMSGCEMAVENFLELGQVDPNLVWRETGDSPLHLALEYKRMEVFQSLMRYGADPTLANEDGSTPLHVMCKTNVDHTWVSMLFALSHEKGQPIRIDARDKLGNTPLHLALGCCNNETVQWLMRRTDLNSTNAEGSTPLHLVCQRRGFGLAELIFEISDEKRQPVRVDARDNLGRTPLQWAVANLKPDAIDALLNRGADLSNFWDWRPTLWPSPSAWRKRIRAGPRRRPDDHAILRREPNVPEVGGSRETLVRRQKVRRPSEKHRDTSGSVAVRADPAATRGGGETAHLLGLPPAVETSQTGIRAPRGGSGRAPVREVVERIFPELGAGFFRGADAPEAADRALRNHLRQAADEQRFSEHLLGGFGPQRLMAIVFQEHPDAFVRVIQVIMVRLQRVTFTALHQYLGLSAELVNQGREKKKYSTVGSPTKSRQRESFIMPPLDNVINSQSGVSEQVHLDAPSKELTNMSTSSSQPVPISSSRRSKSSIEWKLPITSSMLSQHTPDMVPESDSHWPNSATSNPSPANQSAEPPTEFISAGSGGGLHSGSSSRKHSKMEQQSQTPLDEATIVQMATEAFVKELGLEDDSLLKDGKVLIREVPAGTYLMKEESHKDVALVYVVSGSLVISQRVSEGPDAGDDVHMFSAHQGEIVGGLAVLTGEPSFYTIRAKHSSRIALLSKSTFFFIMREKPTVVLHVANTVVKRLSPFVRQVDFALDWQFLESGRAVYRQGDESDSTFIVLSGRLRSVITYDNGKKELVAEYGKGDLVGIVEMVTQTARSTTVMAVRDSELAKLPEGLFNVIKLRYPIVVTRLINLLGHRLLGTWKQSPEIVIMYSRCQRTSIAYRCTSATPITRRGRSDACDRPTAFSSSVWAIDRRPWAARSARSSGSPCEPQKELVLLHKEQGGQRPTNTVQWLNMRSWISSHHHIQCPKRMFTRKSQYRINELYSKVLMSEPNVHSDFSRLARWLTGTSVGLVLGGGGARGAAHVGMLKAIIEAGIPIDMVGGVSIGAFMGALWCMEKNITTTTQKAREWSQKMTQWWRQILDLTYPMTSMFSGKDFNNTIHGTFGDVYIEDLWLPYFTITTDITASCMRKHTHGLLWKYCRASMTFAGVFPPMCDPIDGHLLIDGCYVNNVPADEMLRQGAHHILAIDVGSQEDTDLTNYGDSLSGWWLLWKRWNPFATPVKVPNLPDIQSRLAYVSCVRQLEEVKSSDYCEYIRPPIDRYKTLQFASFDEIKDVGYNHGKTYFEGQSKAGILPRFNADRETARALRAKHHAASQQQQPPSSYTFTDLAQMVCKVSRGNYPDLDSDSDDGMEEYEADLEEDAQEVGGYASEPTVGIMDQSPDETRLRRRIGVVSFSDTEAETDMEYHHRLSDRDAAHQKFFKYGNSKLEM
ncbi:unnamed protein product [Trichogramma brassicae]|uniref:Neuropathy target esterase sws n=1 Tax=Trichogramma brassicae TaxID=86971 RepID=A0A6H5I5F7_9HYME|nr:unnamed protein product [Trichogramma brassicae]